MATPIYEGLDGEESTVVEIGGKLGPHDSLLISALRTRSLERSRKDTMP